MTKAAPGTAQAKLGVDIGGTFTDAALEVEGKRFTTKTLTTHQSPDDGVIEAVGAVLKNAGMTYSDLELVVHGTTLATNALIERRGARTAMLTTEGFRDVIEIGQEFRFDLFDLFLELPAPLISRELRLPIRERIGVGGRELLPLNESDVAAAIEILKREKIESVAICFLHSYANTAHEERVRDLIKAVLPDLSITISGEVAPEMREFERFCTAVANAYVQPKMANYLFRLDQRLRELGLRSPVLMMLSGGGLTDIATAAAFPVRLVESGPAGGALFAASIAAENGLDDVISFDMGGTTAKICLIDNGRPQTSRTFEVARVYRFKKGSGTPIKIPVIEMVEIGAGGGSIAHVDSLGRLTIGPESAGSEPGPAAFSRGGKRPTVTDANLVLRKINPAGFAGGKFALNRGASVAAIETCLSGELRLDSHVAAAAVAEMVEENMASATRVHAVESGKEYRSRVLIAFGGGAPLHAASVMAKLGMRRFLVPPGAGVGSAVGFLRAPVSYEVVRSRHQKVSALDALAINHLLAAMEKTATAIVRVAAGGQELSVLRSASMRYVGQGHEITVSLPSRPFRTDDSGSLAEAFADRYREIYKRNVSGADVEVLTWSVLVTTAAPPTTNYGAQLASFTPTPNSHRKVFDGRSSCEKLYAIFWRLDLKPGAAIQGPAIVEEDETSTVIPEGVTATVLASGAILGEVESARATFQATHEVHDAQCD
ncbi:N-methylhydantoinase A [Bradyrhizobium macuxiense]|uniref:N-methylhydantoinase A n=1 Tax=Bradyrhizobium macuxiense TaxID=1755647 RepID=A0A560KQ50_9BRAD|nr:hydantoinase/oxoprolinase family protein [Bradyrhizobium macuxiense]TWB85306.1 N-methylhydantoinase A [Bradyrhizobium macuxiense]